MILKAPFPYFGGKSIIADRIWETLGQVGSYYEPFFGSGAVLLRRPNYNPACHIETVNDKDGLLANFWRAIKYKPNETAEYADYPVSHVDLAARKKWLNQWNDELVNQMIDDPEWCDPKAAGWWIWAASCWIGGGMITNSKIRTIGKIPHLGDTGKGIHAIGSRPHLGFSQGVCRNENIYEWFQKLSNRLRRVRITCGDWKIICGGNWQDDVKGIAGYFFDPPYSDKAQRSNNIYMHDSLSVAHEVAEWSKIRGEKPTYRIVLAGYYEEHEWLLDHGWTAEQWKANGGYANKGEKTTNNNRFRETLFLSPHCLRDELKLI